MAVCSFLLITTRLSSVSSSILTRTGRAAPFLNTRSSVPVLSSLSLAHGSSTPKARKAVQRNRASFRMDLSYCFHLHYALMAQVEIRDASEDDLPGVMRVLAESGIDGGESFTLQEAREHFGRIRQRPGFRLLVATVEGEIVGTYALAIMEKLGKRGTPAGVVEDVGEVSLCAGQGSWLIGWLCACRGCAPSPR